MTYERQVPGDLDYDFCTYGSSRMRFRGPRPQFDRPYVAFLGGGETFGRFVSKPFPELIGAECGLQCVNLGAPNAGLDLFLNDPSVMRVVEAAQLVVLQIIGAQNMSNRFYRVHPRRNDRFLYASETLRRLYHEIDFTEFHFTNHMLQALQLTCGRRFDRVHGELSSAWCARVGRLISQIPAPVILFWVAPHLPKQEDKDLQGKGPTFVSRGMVAEVQQYVRSYIELEIPGDVIALGTEGMIYPPDKEILARVCSGPAMHEQAAKVLVPVVKSLV